MPTQLPAGRGRRGMAWEAAAAPMMLLVALMPATRPLLGFVLLPLSMLRRDVSGSSLRATWVVGALPFKACLVAFSAAAPFSAIFFVLCCFLQAGC
jgi:hypothetical protein